MSEQVGFLFAHGKPGLCRGEPASAVGDTFAVGKRVRLH